MIPIIRHSTSYEWRIELNETESLEEDESNDCRLPSINVLQSIHLTKLQETGDRAFTQLTYNVNCH